MTVLAAAQVFDGQRMLPDHAVVIEGDRIAAVLPASDVGPVTRLEGTLAPGFLDLQVNGGGGLMVGGDTDVAEATAAVIDAGIRAVGGAGLPGPASGRPASGPPPPRRP